MQGHAPANKRRSNTITIQHRWKQLNPIEGETQATKYRNLTSGTHRTTRACRARASGLLGLTPPWGAPILSCFSSSPPSSCLLFFFLLILLSSNLYKLFNSMLKCFVFLKDSTLKFASYSIVYYMTLRFSSCFGL
jgi:hypothetical protein